MLGMQLPRDIFVFSFFSALLQSYQISVIVEKVKLNFEKLVKVAFFETKLYLCLHRWARWGVHTHPKT